MRHYVKIFYGNFMDTLEKEVNEYTSQIAFSSATAEIRDIQMAQRDHGGITIMVYYVSPYEVQ